MEQCSMGRMLLVLLPFLVTGCAGMSKPAPQPVALAGTSWLAQEILGQPPLAGVVSQLRFADNEQRASGSAGCNRFFGGFEAGGDRLKFGPLGVTRKACAEPRMLQEREFIQALERTRTYHIREHSLNLHDTDGRRLLRFSRIDE